MTIPSSAIIIIIVVAFALYLIYNQSKQSNLNPRMTEYFPQYMQQQYMQPPCPTCHKCDQKQYTTPPNSLPPSPTPPPQPVFPQIQPTITNVNIEGKNDPYSDAIKKQDLYTMYDPLTYPQLRLPREVLDRYNEYYERTGTYPPFNQATQPYLFDNPILNGVLIKICEENEPFSDNIPNSVPLFRVKSSKNANRFFYYVLDQRYLSKIEPKIPLDHVRVNGIYYPNADFYGIPELFDGDVIEHVSIFPGARFKVSLYKSYFFP